jgi:hypothetical protein
VGQGAPKNRWRAGREPKSPTEEITRVVLRWGATKNRGKIGGNKEQEEKGRTGGEEDENHTSSLEMQSRMKNVFRASL